MPPRILAVLTVAGLLAACLPAAAPVGSTASRKPLAPSPAPAPSMGEGSPEAPVEPPGGFLAFGDSLTYQAFSDAASWPAAWEAAARGLATRPAASPSLAAPRDPAVWPLLSAGISGLTTEMAISALPSALGRMPEARVVSLALGTNDAYAGASPEAFQARLESLIRQIRARGAQPMLPTIPFSPHPQLKGLPRYNRVITALNAREGLAPGPDLDAHFRAHPEELLADQIHLTPAGAAAVRELWAEALQRAYGQTTTPPS